MHKQCGNIVNWHDRVKKETHENSELDFFIKIFHQLLMALGGNISINSNNIKPLWVNFCLFHIKIHFMDFYTNTILGVTHLIVNYRNISWNPNASF